MAHTRPRAQWFYARDGDWVAFPPADTSALEEKWTELGGDDPEAFWMARLKDAESETKDEKAEQQAEAGGSQKDEAKPAEPPAAVKASSSGSVPADRDEDAETKGWAATFQNLIWSSGNGQEKKEAAAEAQHDKSNDSANKDEQGQKSDDDEGPPLVEEILDPDEPEENRRFKVAVLEDRLFDVDLETMRMYPAFFKGVLLPVVRSTWFYWSEMRDEYSPIDWSSKFSRALDQAWQDTGASKLGIQPAAGDVDAHRQGGAQSGTAKGEQAKSRKQETELVEIPVEGPAGKGRVRFSSACEASVFSEDFRGRMVSLVGGSTVIRGFDEIERRVKAAKAGGNFFDLPDISLPWGSDEDEVSDAAKASGKAGAARPSKDAPAGGGGYGAKEKQSGQSRSEDTEAAEEDSQGFAARLWPSSGGFWRGLKNLGGGGTEEVKRNQKQQNTEEAAKPDGEVREQSKKTRAPQDEATEEDLADEEEGSDAGKAETEPTEDDEDLNDRKDDPVHLILVIHGIGQGLRDTFESLDFTYDVQKIRNLSRERCQDPAIRKLSRGRRVQYLPICWRRNLSFDYFPEENDNHFRLRDVTNDATIPFVRNVVSKVILDVPYYLSQVHKPKMVTAVKEELNRVYRLFIRRNPDFLEKGGRVSLVGHSLGSCLTADILSNQDTIVPPIEKLSAAEAQALSAERLLFNVQDVFLVGSPLGLFLLLSGGQLKARRTDYNAHVGEDASSDKPGSYGCMAIHGNLYNVYHSSDPVAYRLNGAVDARYARLLRPIPLPGAVNAILDALQQPRLSISQLFDARHPFRGTKGGASLPPEGPFIGQRPDEARYAETSDAARASGAKSKKSRATALAAETKVSVDSAGSSASAAVAVATGKGHGDKEDGGRHNEDSTEEASSSSNCEDEEGEEGEGEGGEGEGAGETNAAAHDALSPPRSGLVSPVRMEAGDRAKRSLPQRVLEVELAERARACASDDPANKQPAAATQRKGAEPPTRPSPSPGPGPDPLSHFDLSLDSLSKAERRFRALNKHGCVDFYFSSSSPVPSAGAVPAADSDTSDSSPSSEGPSEGDAPGAGAGLGGMLSSAANTFGEYVSMLSAHNGYWTSASFVDLVLTQVLQAEDRVPLPGRGAGAGEGAEKKKGKEHDAEDGTKVRTGATGQKEGPGSAPQHEVTMVPSVGKAV